MAKSRNDETQVGTRKQWVGGSARSALLALLLASALAACLPASEAPGQSEAPTAVVTTESEGVVMEGVEVPAEAPAFVKEPPVEKSGSENAGGDGAGNYMIGPGPGEPSWPAPGCPDCKPFNADELANVDVVLNCGEMEAQAFEFELSGIEPSGMNINSTNLTVLPTFEQSCASQLPCNPFAMEDSPTPIWATPPGVSRVRWLYDAQKTTHGIVTTATPDPPHFGYSLQYTIVGQAIAKSNAPVPVPHFMVARFYAEDPDVNPETNSCETAPVSLSLTWDNRLTGTVVASTPQSMNVRSGRRAVGSIGIAAKETMIANIEVRMLDRAIRLNELVENGRALSGQPVLRQRLTIVPSSPALVDVTVDTRVRSVVLKTVWENEGVPREGTTLRPGMTSYHGWNIVWPQDEGLRGPTPGPPPEN